MRKLSLTHYLARLQIEVVLRELTTRIPDYALDEDGLVP